MLQDQYTGFRHSFLLYSLGQFPSGAYRQGLQTIVSGQHQVEWKLFILK